MASPITPNSSSAMTDVPSVAQSSPIELPSPPSEKEATLYYSGLPSKPRLVARTGAPWKEPIGPVPDGQLKELLPVYDHAIGKVWEDGLATKVLDLLNSMKGKWTSLDIVRMKNAEDRTGPVTLWIGVHPGSLSGTDGVVAVHKCRDLLLEYGITDVNVEIRESIVSLLLRVYSPEPSPEPPPVLTP